VTACAVALVATACGKTKSSSSAPGTVASAITLSIDSPQPGTHIRGNVVKLAVKVSGIDIIKANGDTSGRSGHFHVFVDGAPPPAGTVIPKQRGILHSADNPIIVPGLPLGTRRLTVVLGDGAHRRIGDYEAQTTVIVDGPSVVAAVLPPTVAAGTPAVVTMSVAGVTLVAANGDISGKTGHLHLFVDREPTPAGQPIPKEPGIIHTTDLTVSIPNLAPGEHFVWVVLGDGLHKPFDPPVEDKVTFVVTSS